MSVSFFFALSFLFFHFPVKRSGFSLSLFFFLKFFYLHEPREPLVGLVLRRDRRGPRELQLGQLDLRLSVVDARGDLAPGAPLLDGLEFFVVVVFDGGRERGKEVERE